MEKKIYWKPNPRQEVALVRLEDEILYGGARGGGKTDGGIIWMSEPDYIRHPRYRGLVIRRNADDLKDWTDRAEHLYRPLKAIFSGNPTEIKFPSGAKIRTGHLKDDKAYGKYQGHEYQKELIEELTQIPRESQYEKLLGSCRSTIPELKPQVMGTTNPDGDGFDWVKNRFNIPDWPGQEPIVTRDEKTGRTRVFIFSKVEDNPYLLRDNRYVGYLDSITDETLRNQWRHGCWANPNIEGSYYSKIIDRLEVDGKIKDFTFNPDLPVDTFWDLGVGDATAIWFIQIGHMEARIVNYIEFEGEGLTYMIPELQRIQRENGYVYRNHYAPHDIKVREFSTGKSRWETAQKLGITFQIVPNLSLEDGINAVRTILPVCYFSREKCKEGIRALRNYKKEFDEKGNCFKNKPLHNWASHGSDAFRMFALTFSRLADIPVDRSSGEFYKPETITTRFRY